MPANVYLNSFLLDQEATWVKLADVPTVVNATVIVEAAGMGGAFPTLFVRNNGVGSHKWPLGTEVRLEGVNLSEIEVCRNGIDVNVFVIGNTR